MSNSDDDKKRNRPSVLPSLLLAKAIRHSGKKHDSQYLKDAADRLENRTLASVQPNSERVH